ncbi:hypothetical protein B0H66DRAFT_527137 [Apodospora peruviana]|uniref:Uncharacterized protein n=1 Tax=Apodospora peruviana TaxID=516989 RepID=A0AAE0IR21_9PEZI|nr:hypothetical protein B0H66DRAFT_527137 [Apodospora peruviana]
MSPKERETRCWAPRLRDVEVALGTFRLNTTAKTDKVIFSESQSRMAVPEAPILPRPRGIDHAFPQARPPAGPLSLREPTGGAFGPGFTENPSMLVSQIWESGGVSQDYNSVLMGDYRRQDGEMVGRKAHWPLLRSRCAIFIWDCKGRAWHTLDLGARVSKSRVAVVVYYFMVAAEARRFWRRRRRTSIPSLDLARVSACFGYIDFAWHNANGMDPYTWHGMFPRLSQGIPDMRLLPN